MPNFSEKDLQRLFSKERLQSYKNPQEHFDNFYFVGKISPKIGLLEVIIRNKIDKILSQSNARWIYSHKDLLSDDILALQKHQIISKQNLGFWVKIADFYGIHTQIFDKDFIIKLNFRAYYKGNKNKIRHSKLRLTQKAETLLHLIRIVRNRAFHFENLYKLNRNYPRLNVKIMLGKNPLYIAIAPDKIISFLDDVLASFDERLLDTKHEF